MTTWPKEGCAEPGDSVAIPCRTLVAPVGDPRRNEANEPSPRIYAPPIAELPRWLLRSGRPVGDGRSPWLLATTMQGGKTVRILLIVVVAFGLCGVVALRLVFSRNLEFRAQARAGQPIVRAIEEFRKQTGGYPTSLTELAPQYLATLPEIQQEGHAMYGRWEYHLVTNGTVVSYRLRSYMGRGGVEYEPPNWFGNNEGSRKIVLSNE